MKISLPQSLFLIFSMVSSDLVTINNVEDVISNFVSSPTSGFLTFTTKNCSSCQQMAKEFQDMSNRLTVFNFAIVDLDRSQENKKIAKVFNVKQLPTTIFFDEGHPRLFVGVMTPGMLGRLLRPVPL